ncbi:DNA topoisomerase 6 subunit B [Tetrabaena socialis]|uniref:DNA topoisomerase 6 subunit B n=1 Tax=Tetrabaena socialis TaxID=47790 RepID=A0A2J8A569_9CHLO|nr:DNA topoisomerase 6 subunit B [Tetrabaena socialis]|eukprot:PNH07647.1 DNA topoisomerase 6 subunit B [Tetrabaena socialis]
MAPKAKAAKADELVQKSPAEFFAENKNIAGFDNVRKFGLGAKMALIWSKMTTGLPFEIASARPGSATRSHYLLDIDIHRNEPNVHLEEQLPNPDGWHGSVLSLTIEGNWTYYRPKVIRYLRQIAVITPYAQFSFAYKAEDDRNSMRCMFRKLASSWITGAGSGINVYRFANRIPLLFEGGSDVITKTALRRINWSAYKIEQRTDKVGVFVSIVSTKIPFKGAGKEYIGDDVEEMVGAVKAAIQALEYQVLQGQTQAKELLYLAPLTARHSHGPELHANAAVLRLAVGFT